MKTTRSLISLALLVLAALVAGCSNIPNGEFKDWSHDGNYAVFTSHYEAHGAKKREDGKIVVDSYTGGIKFAGGYGPSDTITGLVIDPKTPPVSVQVLPTK